jgi:hypothetical protein
MIQRLLVIFLFLLLGCQNSKNKIADFTLESFDKSITLENGKIFKNDSLFLGNPRWLKFHSDSFLIISELGKSTKFIKIIDLKSNKVQEMIPNGQGPGEMITAWGLGVINKKIWVYDAQLGKMCILKMDNNRKFSISHEFSLKAKLCVGANVVNDSLVVCLSGIEDTKNRLIYFDFSGNIVKKTGNFPKLKNANDISGDNNIFQSAISSTPNGDKVILACNCTDIIEFYNINKELEKRIHGPIGLEVTAIKRNIGIGYMTHLEPMYSTYNNIASSDSEIWISYSGKQFKKGEKMTNENVFPKSILCFNYEGEPSQILNFKNNILYFDVDWLNKVVYCLEWENETPSIVSYKL